MHRLRIVLALFVFLGSALAQSFQPGDLSIHISVARDAKAPLQVVGILYAANGFQITLENSSQKTIRKFSVAGILEDAHRCLWTGERTEQGGSEQTATLPPGGRIQTTLYHHPFSPSSLVMGAAEIGTRALNVRVSPRTVEFTDGTEWRAWEPPAPHKKPASADPVACEKFQSDVAPMHAITKVGFKDLRAGDSLRAAGSQFSLSYKCDLDGNMATCP